MTQRDLLIAGFHRSATSALAASLHAAGWPLGTDLMAPHHSNPGGHFEDTWLVDIDNALLAAQGLNWQCADAAMPHPGASQLAAMAAYVEHRARSGRPWAAKDPRSGLLAAAWRDVGGPALGLICPVRHPLACATSLRQRHARILALRVEPQLVERELRFWTEPTLALRMWLLHHQRLLEVAAMDPQAVDFLGTRELSARYGLGESGASMPGAARSARPAPSWPDAEPALLAQLQAMLARLPPAVDGALATRPQDEQPPAWRAHLDRRIDALPFTGADRAPGAAGGPLAAEQRLARQQRWLELARRLDAMPAVPAAPAGADKLATERRRLRAAADQGMGEWARALQAWSSVLAAQPGNAAARVGTIECLLFLGRFEACGTALQEWLESSLAHSAPVWVWQRLGGVARRLDDPAILTAFGRGLDAPALPAPQRAALRAVWALRSGALEVACGELAACADHPATLGARIELALRQGRPGEARRLEAQAFLQQDSAQSYRQYLDEVLGQVPDEPERADLGLRIADVLERLAADAQAP